LIRGRSNDNRIRKRRTVEIVTDFALQYGDHVTRARRDGRPVVALESTIVSHGLPRPDNLRVAREIEQTVRDNGAVPATIGMIGGRLIVGLTDPEIEHLAGADGVAKLSVRDLAIAAATGADGATTVAATSAIAASAGIQRPDHPGADADRRGVRRRQVDPRCRRDAGTAGDAGSVRRRLRNATVPGLFHY
jgi:pseudouridine-5'-phosphate glycosidase